MTSVVSRSEAGQRGYVAMLAKYGEKRVNEWRRSGGRRKDPSLIEILERERNEAATRRSRRVSSRKEEG